MTVLQFVPRPASLTGKDALGRVVYMEADDLEFYQSDEDNPISIKADSCWRVAIEADTLLLTACLLMLEGDQATLEIWIASTESAPYNFSASLELHTTGRLPGVLLHRANSERSCAALLEY